MNLLLLPPIFACIACCVLSAAIVRRGSQHRANRLAAAMTLAAAFWALCEVVWSIAYDPDAVIRLVRLSTLGWMSIGPITLHLFLELTEHPSRKHRSLLAALYGTNAVLVLIALSTSLVHVEAIRMSWGWAYRVGPLFPVLYAFTFVTFFAGVLLGLRDFPAALAPVERRHALVLSGCMLAGLAVASLTDGLLPALGHYVPRLGVAAITLLAAAVSWGFQRYGYSLLAPGVFAPEILATLPDGVALLRLDGRIRFANPGLCAMAETDTLEGRSIESLIADTALVPALEITGSECVLETATGDFVAVAVSTSLLRDKQENLIGLVLVARDQREVESLRNRLIVSDRLAAVGQLAAGIAHEINNPVAFVRANLTALGGLVDTVDGKLPADLRAQLGEQLEDGREMVEESLQGVDRVSAIVRDVKGFAYSGQADSELIDLRPLLDSVVRVSTPQMPSGCTVECSYGEVPEVVGAAQEIKQVFLNLVINAAQAMREGGKIRLTTLLEDSMVVTLVEDEGCGIAPEVINRIFDPFFTTKQVGEGTGLGLSISYQIVNSHGGNISVESEPGRTRFRVDLPAAPPD